MAYFMLVYEVNQAGCKNLLNLVISDLHGLAVTPPVTAAFGT